MKWFLLLSLIFLAAVSFFLFQGSVTIENTSSVSHVTPTKTIEKPQIIKKVEAKIVKPDGIYVDLGKMELELWKDEEMTLYPVLAIRKGFKNFNTPTGEFEALYKTKNHLSSLFDVWMPYSVQFHGDYFLHGYPTYNDAERTPVPYGTSGGCIRMDTDDMREIFESIEIGIPINIQ